MTKIGQAGTVGQAAWTGQPQSAGKFALRRVHATPNVWGVKLSVKSDYAARAVLGLARHYPGGAAMRVEQLAAEQGIPPNYLLQILIELKAQGIVRSLRGKSGGYLLARPPAEVTLADVLRAVHGQVFDSTALGVSDCPPELRRAWEQMQHAVEEAGGKLNFQRLVDESGEKEKMYYI